MTPFAVTFTNNHGRHTVVVFDSNEEQAIKQAIDSGTVTIFSKVEASVILNPIEGKSIAIKQP